MLLFSYQSPSTSEIYISAFTIKHNCILCSALTEFKNKSDLFVITGASALNHESALEFSRMFEICICFTDEKLYSLLP